MFFNKKKKKDIEFPNKKVELEKNDGLAIGIALLSVMLPAFILVMAVIALLIYIIF